MYSSLSLPRLFVPYNDFFPWLLVFDFDEILWYCIAYINKGYWLWFIVAVNLLKIVELYLLLVRN